MQDRAFITKTADKILKDAEEQDRNLSADEAQSVEDLLAKIPPIDEQIKERERHEELMEATSAAVAELDRAPTPVTKPVLPRSAIPT
jgi:mRNA-degrading endonuclease RelE of RelBE toxin-antitoxin system